MSCRIGIEVTSPSTLSRSRQGEVGGPRNGTVLRDAAREGVGGRRMRGLRGAARKISVAGKLLALCCLHAVPTTKHGSTLCDIHTLPHPPRSGGKKARGAAASKSPPPPGGAAPGPAGVRLLCGVCQSALLLPLDSAHGQPPPTVDSAVVPPISCPAQAPPGRLRSSWLSRIRLRKERGKRLVTVPNRDSGP